MPAPLVLPAPSPPAPTTTQGSTFTLMVYLHAGLHIGFYDVQKSQNLQHKKKHPFKYLACCKLCLGDLCPPTTCFFASSTLKIGVGRSSTAWLRPKNTFFTKKRPFFAIFFHEKWQILVQMHAVNCVGPLCPYNLLVGIQHPQNRGRGSSTAYLKLKKPNLWQKNNHFWPFFHEKWQILVHTHAVNCVFVIYMPLQPASSYPAPSKWRGGVFNCLSEAKRTEFLTRNWPIFSIFHEKRQILVHTDAVNCDILLCVCLHPAFSHPAPSK